MNARFAQAMKIREAWDLDGYHPWKDGAFLVSDVLVEFERDLTKTDAAFAALKQQHAASDVALIDAKAEIVRLNAQLRADRAAAAEALIELGRTGLGVVEGARARQIIFRIGTPGNTASRRQPPTNPGEGTRHHRCCESLIGTTKNVVWEDGDDDDHGAFTAAVTEMLKNQPPANECGAAGIETSASRGMGA